MYIEFYGLPATGKSTFSNLINKSMNEDPKWKNSPSILSKIFFSYSRFFLYILIRFFTHINFMKGVLKNPVHFAAFMKGMLVRFIVVFRHQKSGFFASGHGLIQTLSQEDVLLEELIEDRKFLLKLFRLLQKKNILYVYLETSLSHSLLRAYKRDQQREFSYKYMSDRQRFFKLSRTYFNSPTILTAKKLSSIKGDINKIIMLCKK